MERAPAETTAAARAREEARKPQLDSLLTVTLVSKGYLPKDPDLERFDDYISLTFAYRNKGTKPVRAFQGDVRSEEHTSELQSLAYLVCRLLLEKKNKQHCNYRLIQVL